MNQTVRTYIIGQNSGLSKRVLLGAVVLCLGALIAIRLSYALELWRGTGYNLVGYEVVFLVLAVAIAYLNDGLGVILALTSLPLIGVFLAGSGIGFRSNLSWIEASITAVEGGLVFGLPPSCVGFVVGAGSRRLISGSQNT